MGVTRRAVLGTAGLAPLLTARSPMTTPTVRGLGHRDQLGVSDALQKINPFLPGTGWDVIFAPTDLGIPPDGEVEVYHIYIDGPVGSSVDIRIDGQRWDFVSQGWQNGWDPQQPLLLRGGVTLAFFWSTAFFAGPYDKTGTAKVQPTATLWLRRPDRGVLG